MTPNFPNNKIVEKLVNKSDNPCISLLISTDLKSFDDREKIILKLKKCPKQVEEAITDQYNQEKVEKIVSSVEKIVSSLNFLHLPKGIGIYVTQDFHELIFFSGKVEDLLVVNNFFDTRAIEAAINKTFWYGILILSKNKCRLIKANGDQLDEIEDENFPQKMDAPYRISHTSPGSFYNQEESKINQTHLREYFRKIDKLLDQYVKDFPLIIIGVTKYLSEFRLVSKHKSRIIAGIEGNHDKDTHAEILSCIRPEIEKFSRQKEAEIR